MRITIEVCDVCEDPNRETTPYSIRKDGGKMQRKVLCDEHAGPIEVLLGAEATTAPRSRRSPEASRRVSKRTARGRSRHVVSIEEIEKAKAAANK